MIEVADESSIWNMNAKNQRMKSGYVPSSSLNSSYEICAKEKRTGTDRRLSDEVIYH